MLLPIVQLSPLTVAPAADPNRRSISDAPALDSFFIFSNALSCRDRD